MNDTADTTTEAPAEPREIGARATSIAGYVARLPRGERAELRRLERGADRVPPEVFWRVVDRYAIPPADEEFWLAVLPLLVRHPHAPKHRPGRILARAGVSAARIERWLRLDRVAALREAGRLLSQVDDPIDWTWFSRLLYHWTEKLRRAFARDFFLSDAYRARLETEPAKGAES